MGSGSRRGARWLVTLAVAAAPGCTLAGYPSGGGATSPTPVDVPAPGVRPRSAPAPAGARSDAGRTYEVFGERYRVMDTARGYREVGLASWYGEAFHGRPTASGERYDMHALSAAHRTLPLHTWIEVLNLENGRALILRVNDRGPFADTDHRILDLSFGAARELGVVGPGLARVEVRALDASELDRLR